MSSQNQNMDYYNQTKNWRYKGQGDWNINGLFSMLF